MASILAIVSKAVYEPFAGAAAPGTVLPFTRYASTHRALDPLAADGGALFLVTVRPPDERLWLVGVLDTPAKRADGWHATNTSPIADITPLVARLVLANGKGLTAKPGALAMSLQTPRALADEDVALLRAAVAAGGTRTTAPRAARTPTAAPGATRTPTAAPTARTTSARGAPRTTTAARGATRTTAAVPTARTTAARRATRTTPAPRGATRTTTAPRGATRTTTAAPGATTTTAAPAARTPTSAHGGARGSSASRARRGSGPGAATAEVFDLGAIAAALEEGDAAAALLAALAGWRQTRAAALADLVHAIAAKLEGAPITGGEAAWSAAARARDPLALGPLLAAIPALPASFLPTAGGALAAFPDDPRIAMAVATWARDPPTTSSSTYPFWTKALDAMARAGDERAVPLLRARLAQAPGGSQFWPKFYKALDRAIRTIEATPRVAVDEKRVGKLAKTAAKLAATTSPGTARVEASGTGRAAMPAVVDGPPLAQARAHLEAGRLPAAIAALGAAWRASERAPRIAEAIDRATRLLPAWDRPLGLDDRAVQAAWDAAFAEDPQGALPQLLENLVVGGPAAGERHLVMLAELPDDPRIAVRLAELCAGRVVSPERTQFWKSLLELLARVRDPRVAPALRVTFRDFTGTYYNHHRQARRIIGAWAQDPPVPPQLGPREAAELAAIEQRLDALAARRDPTERALLDAIVDAWDDNAPRLVYADWLAEQQHPRGEVIVLACKAKRSDAEAKRLRELLRKTTNLYGPLEDVASAWQEDRGLGLDRGLPTRIEIDWGTSPLVWRKLRGHPLLTTITELAFGSGNVLVPPAADLAAVLLDPTARRLARVAGLPADLGRALRPLVDGKWRLTGKALVRA